MKIDNDGWDDLFDIYLWVFDRNLTDMTTTWNKINKEMNRRY